MHQKLSASMFRSTSSCKLETSKFSTSSSTDKKKKKTEEEVRTADSERKDEGK